METLNKDPPLENRVNVESQPKDRAKNLRTDLGKNRKHLHMKISAQTYTQMS